MDLGQVHFTYILGDDSDHRLDPSPKLELEEWPLTLGSQEVGSKIAVLCFTADAVAIAFQKMK